MKERKSMAESEIPVDLFNPGQVFACLGFLEAADILLGDAEGGFDWSLEAEPHFRLRAAGSEQPVEAVIRFLRDETTNVEWMSPSEEIIERDGGKTVILKNISTSSEPKSADLPGRLVGTYHEQNIVLNFGFWADGSSRFHTTFKKSTNGSSSHVRFQSALSAIRSLDFDASIKHPFEQKGRTKSLFRLDPRGSTDSIGSGFSPDRIRKGETKIDIRVSTYPICEALAILGLEHARPRRLWNRSSDAFLYHVWGSLRPDARDASVLLPPILARMAINGALPFVTDRCFCVEHEETKKAGDRKMTRITEESTK
jgi:CRISPR-associated protein Csb3